MRNENEKSFSVEGRMEIVFSLSPYLLKQIFNAVPLIKPLIICRFPIKMLSLEIDNVHHINFLCSQ